MGAETLMYSMLGVSAVGTGLSTAQAYADAEAQKQAYRINSLQANQNAQLARLNAQTTRDIGVTEANDVRRDYKILMGDQRTGYGASGVSVNTGSAAAVVSNTAAEGEYEAQKTEYARALEAWSIDQEAANYEFEAAKYNAAARNGNSWLSAASAGIGGLTNMYSSHYNWTSNTKKK